MLFLHHHLIEPTRFLLAVCIVKKERNVYVGFRTYLVFSSKDVIGPITPSLGSPSFKNVQSCHSEVGAIKLAESFLLQSYSPSTWFDRFYSLYHL